MAKAAARAVLKRMRITGPPVNLDDVLRARKIVLKRVDVDGPLSGVLHAEDREIVVNTRGRSVQRQRFTIAHELGHFELRHFSDQDLPDDHAGFAGDYEADGRPPKSGIEVEANCFAAELLMPSVWIRRLPKGVSLGEPERLAETFQVSREAMFYQLMANGRL